VIPDQQVLPDRRPFHHAVHNGEVLFFYPPLPDQGAEKPGPLQGFGKNNDTAGRFVQPVQRPGAERQGRGKLPRKIGPDLIVQTPRPVDCQPRSLVQKKEALFFPKYIKGGGRREEGTEISTRERVIR
jgi:hypothetical protein